MNIYYTYIIFDPRNKQPVYVGKGTGQRMYDHWKKREQISYGGNKLFKAFLIELDQSMLTPDYEKVAVSSDEHFCLQKERELIQQYRKRSEGGTLFNTTSGGEGLEKTVEFCAWKSGHERAKDKGRPIKQFTLQGEFIMEFPSARRASESVPEANQSYITQVCKKAQLSAGGFIWRYSDDEEPIAAYQRERTRLLDQFDSTGNIIATFIGVTEAEKATGVPRRNISTCCRGKCQTAGGFGWRYRV